MTTVNGIDLDEALRLIRQHMRPGDTLGKMFMRVAKELETVGDKRRSGSVDSALLAQSFEPPFAGWRWRIRGHWRGPGWVMTERLPEFTDDADVEIERLCVAPVDARPQPVGEIQRQFYVWWEGHQKDPSHGMITQNCALATWHGAYDLYVRGHHSLWSHHAGCLLCGRPIGEHSMNTADICNTFIGGSK